jgi:hypothetical protein
MLTLISEACQGGDQKYLNSPHYSTMCHGQICDDADLIQIKALVFQFSIFNMIYNISAANAEVLDILLFTLQMILASIRAQA